MSMNVYEFQYIVRGFNAIDHVVAETKAEAWKLFDKSCVLMLEKKYKPTRVYIVCPEVIMAMPKWLQSRNTEAPENQCKGKGSVGRYKHPKQCRNRTDHASGLCWRHR